MEQKLKLDDQEELISKTYVLARQAQANGNHPFAALLVIDGEVVLECLNTVNTSNDATQHAELELVRMANTRFDASDLRKATLYTSTEPCAMCAGAIYWSEIGAIVYGCSAETLGKIAGGRFVVPCRELLANGEREIKVKGPLLEEEGAEIHRGFW